jgi:hypothetical protein
MSLSQCSDAKNTYRSICGSDSFPHVVNREAIMPSTDNSYEKQFNLNNLPLMREGIDVSKKTGAERLALTIRRYWATQGWDVPVEIQLNIDAGVAKPRGKAVDFVVYGPRADFKRARPLTPVEKRWLIRSIDEGRAKGQD